MKKNSSYICMYVNAFFFSISSGKYLKQIIKSLQNSTNMTADVSLAALFERSLCNKFGSSLLNSPNMMIGA